MRTGQCKFGTECKYHHPPEVLDQSVGSNGKFKYPERPGASLCQVPPPPLPPPLISVPDYFCVTPPLQ